MSVLSSLSPSLYRTRSQLTMALSFYLHLNKVIPQSTETPLPGDCRYYPINNPEVLSTGRRIGSSEPSSDTQRVYLYEFTLKR